MHFGKLLKKRDLVLSCCAIFICIIGLIHFGNQQCLDFDASYNMLSYQNLFNGKGFVYDYNGRQTYFDPVISTGPELYFPTYLLWLIQGKTNYFTAIYVLIAYYAAFFLFFVFYVLKNRSYKFLAVLLIVIFSLCNSHFFSEWIILSPKGEPIAGILLFIGLFLFIEKRKRILASLIIGFALDVKPNIIVALFPVLFLLFFFEFLWPVFKSKNSRHITKKIALLACYGILIITPNLVHTKLVPFITLDKDNFKVYSEIKQNRNKTLMSKGFGHLLRLTTDSDPSSDSSFQQILSKKYKIFKTYFHNNRLSVLLFWLSLPLLIWVSYHYERFAFYLLIFSTTTVVWWFTCPLDAWYRYFSLVDIVYIMGSVVLIVSLFHIKKVYLASMTLSILFLIFIPRFSFFPFTHYTKVLPIHQKEMFELCRVVEKIPDEQIFTYGWFQAPQIMFLTNKRFNDLLDEKRLKAARERYKDLYYIETIENEIIKDKLESQRKRFKAIHVYGYNRLYKIVDNFGQPSNIKNTVSN